uniref:NADH dehydrogenase [ubiquinone] 1 beta subcomplex subunit 3 n=1 Tax=Acrobeloides nanus TaxID=290746 RepID=A0A914DQK4_9BILA
MGGGHHEPFKVPDYKIYSNYKAFPQLSAYEKRLSRLGLKDPWIRNYVWLFDRRFENVQGILTTTKNLLKVGIKPGLIAAVTVIAIEEIYSKVKHGHTSWGKTH